MASEQKKGRKWKGVGVTTFEGRPSFQTLGVQAQKQLKTFNSFLLFIFIHGTPCFEPVLHISWKVDLSVCQVFPIPPINNWDI